MLESRAGGCFVAGQHEDDQALLAPRALDLGRMSSIPGVQVHPGGIVATFTC